MIKIEIQNRTCKLSGNPKALEKLREELSYRHPNAFYIQKKLKYNWDGMVWPLSKKGIIQTGLLQRAVDFLSKTESEYEIIDHRRIPQVGLIPYKVGDLEMTGKYSFQRRCIEALVNNQVLGISHPRGVIAAAMNAGKTGIMMGIHLSYLDARTLILINNKVMYEQLKADLKRVFPDTYGYMQGKNLQWGEIMVCMVQTLKNRVDAYSEELLKYNILLTDECDIAANDTFEYVYDKLAHISVRAGFSGTVFLRDLKKDKQKNTNIRQIFGEALFTIDMQELETLKVSTPAVIKSIVVPPKTTRGENFLEEFREKVTNNTGRHNLILQRILYNLRVGRKHILVFCKYIDQTEILFEFLKNTLPNKYSIDYTHHKRQNPEVIKGFKEGRINVLVTSLYLKRGMNFPLTNTILNVAGGEWYSNPLQIAGRGVRKHASKKRFFLEDFADSGKYLGKHSRQRIKYYTKAGYKVRIIYP